MIPPGPVNDPSAAFQRQVAQDALQRSQTAGQRSGDRLTAEIAERAQQNPNRATDVRRADRPADAANRTETASDRRDVGARRDTIEIRSTENAGQRVAPEAAAREPEPAVRESQPREAAAPDAQQPDPVVDRTEPAGRALAGDRGAEPATSDGAERREAADNRDFADQREPVTARVAADAAGSNGAEDAARPDAAGDGDDAETQRVASELAGTLSILNGASTSGSLVNITI